MKKTLGVLVVLVALISGWFWSSRSDRALSAAAEVMALDIAPVLSLGLVIYGPAAMSKVCEERMWATETPQGELEMHCRITAHISSSADQRLVLRVPGDRMRSFNRAGFQTKEITLSLTANDRGDPEHIRYSASF
jgi:hypothetical protein